MAKPRWLTPQEQQAWRAYRKMRVLLDLQLARDLAADQGLSEADYDVLSTLTEAADDRWRSYELGNRLMWSRSRLSHQITRMEGRGLVRREDCADDARGAMVVLTAAGRRAIEAAAPGHVASVREHLIDVLTPEQVQALGAISAQVVDHLIDVKD